MLRCQRDTAGEGAGRIEKGGLGGLRRGFLGSFSQRARSGLGRFVIFWQIRTRCRGQHLTQREDASPGPGELVAGQLDEGVNGGNRHK